MWKVPSGFNHHKGKSKESLNTSDILKVWKNDRLWGSAFRSWLAVSLLQVWSFFMWLSQDTSPCLLQAVNIFIIGHLLWDQQRVTDLPGSMQMGSVGHIWSYTRTEKEDSVGQILSWCKLALVQVPEDNLTSSPLSRFYSTVAQVLERCRMFTGNDH